MPKSFISFGLFLLLSLLSVQCFGDIKPGRYYLSPYIGGYTFDGTQHLETRPVYGIRFGYNYTGNLGIEALFDYTWTNLTKGTFIGNPNAKSYGYGLDALYHFMPDRNLVPFVAAGLRGISVDYPQGQSDQNSAAFDYGGGLEYGLTDAVSIRGDIRHLIVLDHARSNLEYTIGISYSFGAAPAPAVPVSPPPAPEANLTIVPASILPGHQAELSWSSRDATNCEIRPVVGPVEPQGSTHVTPSADAVYTLICNGPGGAASSQANVKVVAPAPVPAPAPAAKPVPVPEAKHEPAPIPKEMLCYTMNIEFATGKADILPAYHAELVKLADFMKTYPSVKGVIEGHTDNRGGKEYNIRLSERRAASVVAYLVNLGIDKTRLGTKGYGFSRPIADNTTAAGRQKNRRIVANFDCVQKH
jgi:OmpA-OmpF porin, OOP family